MLLRLSESLKVRTQGCEDKAGTNTTVMKERIRAANIIYTEAPKRKRSNRKTRMHRRKKALTLLRAGARRPPRHSLELFEASTAATLRFHHTSRRGFVPGSGGYKGRNVIITLLFSTAFTREPVVMVQRIAHIAESFRVRI